MRNLFPNSDAAVRSASMPDEPFSRQKLLSDPSQVGLTHRTGATRYARPVFRRDRGSILSRPSANKEYS